MKFKVLIVFVFFICCLWPGISLAQNKVVVIPLFVDSGPPTVTSTTGRIWMDRNLGALRRATKSADPDAYGALYQWGRLTDGHEYRASGTTSTTSPDNVPGHDDFILDGNSSPYDWRVPQEDSLWQGESSVNNPCPDGFRLPTRTEWEIEALSWGTQNAAGAFASPLKLVVAGNRNHADGTLLNAGSSGYYWGSTISVSYASYLSFNNGNAGMLSSGRAYGYSVRCIKD